MFWLCAHWPEGVGSSTCRGCYDFVRTDQRGWDLLGRGEGFFRHGGCYDFVRADQRACDLLTFKHDGWMLWFHTRWPEGVGSFRCHGWICWHWQRRGYPEKKSHQNPKKNPIINWSPQYELFGVYVTVWGLPQTTICIGSIMNQW